LKFFKKKKDLVSFIGNLFLKPDKNRRIRRVCCLYTTIS